MYTHLLVPLDGSERAERALPVAERIARYSGSRMTLLQVVSRPAPLSGLYMPQAPTASWIEQDAASARTYLTHIADWPLLHGLSVEIKVEIGSPAEDIAAVAEAAGVDLIVLCSHGRTGAARWLAGSIAERVSRQVSIPVLVLREHGPVPSIADIRHDRPVLMRALVPLDGSSFAEEALEPTAKLILALAGLGQAVIHLVVVLPPTQADPQTIPEHPALQGTRIYLMRAADRLRAIYPRLTVCWSILPGHEAASVLPGMAETDGSARMERAQEQEQGQGQEQASSEFPYDLVAMATHGRSGVARWALGSVTEAVLHHTTLPLLVVHPSPTATEKAARHTQQPDESALLTEEVHVTGGEAESLWTPLY